MYKKRFLSCLYFLRNLALGWFLLNMLGCAWKDSSGVRHTIILGFGYVSRSTTTGITASDVGAVGIHCEQGLSLGLIRKRSVEISPTSAPNAIVSIEASPFSLTVKNFDPYEIHTIHEEEIHHDSP